MKRIVNLVSFVCLLVSLYFFVSVALRALQEWHDVDRCLDDGGTFDYSRMSCDQDQGGPTSYPYIAYSLRHPNDVPIAKASFCSLLVFAIVYLLTRPRRPKAHFPRESPAPS